MNKNIKIIINYVLGPLVFLVILYFIYRQVIRQPNWRESLGKVSQAIAGPKQWRLWMIIALMPVNWGIEAFKWKLALRQAGGIPYRDAFKAIFTGTTLASFTPNRMGEYLGRMLYVREGRRIDSISLTIVCSAAQIMITVLIGTAGVLYLRSYLEHPAFSAPGIPGIQIREYWIDILLGLSLLLLASLTIIYFRLSWLVGKLGRIPVLGRYQSHLKVLESVDATILVPILFLSFARYLVFIVQYGLVFPVFGVFLGAGQLWGGVSVVFLVMAVVPTFTVLTDLGLRWGASIQVLQLFSANTVGIFAASFAIWLINLIIPALIGSLLILSIKPVKDR